QPPPPPTPNRPAEADTVASRRRPAPAPTPQPPPTPAQLRPRVSRRLLAWFDRHRRDLPWRRDRDPYRIWVSARMLQQTQVATATPFFERFLGASPDLASLAAAEEQAVLRLGEGLGYYRRARDLHRAARQMVERHGGRVPDDPEEAAALPGF